MRKILAAAAAVAIAGAGAVALTGFAGGCGAHRHGHGRDPAELAAFVTDRVDDALDDVDATPDQRTRIHAVKERLLAAGQKARGGHRDAHEALRAEWTAEQPDGAKLHALVDARAEEMKAFAHQAVDAGIEVHGILTPEQRAKLTKKVDRWHR
jgi:Spy/CpxP family protein refolding chaperone